MIELSFKRAIRVIKHKLQETYIELWQTQHKPFPQQFGLKSRSFFEQQTMPTFLQLPTWRCWQFGIEFL